MAYLRSPWLWASQAIEEIRAFHGHRGSYPVLPVVRSILISIAWQDMWSFVQNFVANMTQLSNNRQNNR
jgi:hypothetical protein